jgi:hypothetical protein
MAGVTLPRHLLPFLVRACLVHYSTVTKQIIIDAWAVNLPTDVSNDGCLPIPIIAWIWGFVPNRGATFLSVRSLVLSN